MSNIKFILDDETDTIIVEKVVNNVFSYDRLNFLDFYTLVKNIDTFEKEKEEELRISLTNSASKQTTKVMDIFKKMYNPSLNISKQLLLLSKNVSNIEVPLVGEEENLSEIFIYYSPYKKNMYNFESLVKFDSSNISNSLFSVNYIKNNAMLLRINISYNKNYIYKFRFIQNDGVYVIDKNYLDILNCDNYIKDDLKYLILYNLNYYCRKDITNILQFSQVQDFIFKTIPYNLFTSNNSFKNLILTYTNSKEEINWKGVFIN